MPSGLTLAFIPQVIKGHSNVTLVTIRRLLSFSPEEGPRLDIHIIADEPLRHDIANLTRPNYHTLTFHSTGEEDYSLQRVEKSIQIRQPPPSLFKKGGLIMFDQIAQWTFFSPDMYTARYHRIKQLLKDIRVDLAVVDSGLHFAQEACKHAGIRYAILTPVSSFDVARNAQPYGRTFWKYPATFTLTPYPVPVMLIPYNIVVCVLFIYTLFTSPRLHAMEKARRAAGIPGTILRPLDDGPALILCPSHPAWEYPHVPLRNTVFIGPILSSDNALSALAHPELARFLAEGRTLVVNMGTLFRHTIEDIHAFLDAFIDARIRLRDHGGIRILWKLRDASSFQSILDAKLGKDWSWIRIEEWLKPRSLEILKHPNVVAIAHHGGANTVHEALYAGVPQIILPQWYDLYLYARRVESLGHGICANKRREAEIDGPQLANAIVRTFRDAPGEPGSALKKKAIELAEICQGTQGDLKAAQTIISVAQGQQVINGKV